MQYLPLLSPEVAIFSNQFFKERSSTARHIPWPHLLHGLIFLEYSLDVYPSRQNHAKHVRVPGLPPEQVPEQQSVPSVQESPNWPRVQSVGGVGVGGVGTGGGVGAGPDVEHGANQQTLLPPPQLTPWVRQLLPNEGAPLAQISSSICSLLLQMYFTSVATVSVGELVGFAVGLLDGLAVGLRVGALEGLGVGGAVGCLLGEDDGALEGLSVGLVVGEDVGG